MDYPPGQKNVAVAERWPLEEVRLYKQTTKTYKPHTDPSIRFFLSLNNSDSTLEFKA